MLLGSLMENIFGFTGTYARKQQASLAPSFTGWKRWTEFNIVGTENMTKDSWLVNLRIAGSVSTHTVRKAVSWNVGPHGYRKGKKEIHKKIRARAPHNLPSGCTNPQKTEKLCQKGPPTGVSLLLGLYHHDPGS